MEITNIVLIAASLYVASVAGLLRIFQAIRKRDDLMRAITDAWIKESGVSLDPK